MMKSIVAIHAEPNSHWVGDGFPVRNFFHYAGLAPQISPFLLLDYAGPSYFAPADKPRGVGPHPHRGFETVTVVYQGEVAHRDSKGNAGVIGVDEVQWMTAAAGILHEEFHSMPFTQRGGTLEMVQLWVNLPKRDKMHAPRYQGITRDKIPVVQSDSGQVRVIAGSYQSVGDTPQERNAGAVVEGVAQTFSPINLWDVRVLAGKTMRCCVPDGHTAMFLVLSGRVMVNGSLVNSSELVQLSSDKTLIEVQASVDAVLLFMGGAPLNEPIVGYGPFVMNTEVEILQARRDFGAGLFGQMD